MLAWILNEVLVLQHLTSRLRAGPSGSGSQRVIKGAAREQQTGDGKNPEVNQAHFTNPLLFIGCYYFTVKQAAVTNTDTHCSHFVYCQTDVCACACARASAPEEKMTVVAGSVIPREPVWWSCRRLLPWLNVDSKHLMYCVYTVLTATPHTHSECGVGMGVKTRAT